MLVFEELFGSHFSCRLIGLFGGLVDSLYGGLFRSYFCDTSVVMIGSHLVAEFLVHYLEDFSGVRLGSDSVCVSFFDKIIRGIFAGVSRSFFGGLFDFLSGSLLCITQIF